MAATYLQNIMKGRQNLNAIRAVAALRVERGIASCQCREDSMGVIPLTRSTLHRVLWPIVSYVTDATIGMPSLKLYLDLKVKERTLGPLARGGQSMPSTGMQI